MNRLLSGLFLMPLALGCSDAGSGSDLETAGSGGSHSPAGGSGGTSSAGSAGTNTGVAGASAGTTSGAGSGSGGTASGGNAGSTAVAGTGGDQNVPQTVLACDSLSDTGVFENITPPGVTFTQDFVLHPTDAGTLYVGSAKFEDGAGGIYKSTDCGANWVLVNTGENSEAIGGGGKWTLVIDHTEPDTLFTANGYGVMGVFKTTNAGVDWKQVLPEDIAQYFDSGGHVERITMDPTDHLHLLVTPHFKCVGAHEGDCILETKDGGTSWTVLDNGPPGGEDTGQMMIDSLHWLYAASDWHLWQTLDGGASWQQVFEGWTSDQDLYQASDGSYYLAAEAGGVIRSMDGTTWSAIPGSPQSIRAVIGDGTTLFTSNRRDCDDCQPYMQAPEDNPVTFVNYPSPPLPRGGWRLHYDTSHHIFYSSTETNGLWRVVTK